MTEPMVGSLDVVRRDTVLTHVYRSSQALSNGAGADYKVVWLVGTPTSCSRSESKVRAE